MEEKIELVSEESDLWDSVDRNKTNRWFKPVANQNYQVVFKSAELRSEAYPNTPDAKKRLRLYCQMDKLDNQPCDLVFATSSFTVIREVKKYIALKGDGSLPYRIFLLKMKLEGDKKSYVFEMIGEVQRREGRTEAYV